MQSSHPSAAEIANHIIKSFDNFPSRLADAAAKGDRAWTTQIKEDIGSLGEKHGWTICASGFPDRFERGWLYDLIWYKEEGGHLAEVYLILESEWGKTLAHIKYDFEKLLLAKCGLKVMIFQARNRDLETLFEFLKAGIHAFPAKSANEIYLLIAYNNDTEKFEIRQVNGSGQTITSSQTSGRDLVVQSL